MHRSILIFVCLAIAVVALVASLWSSGSARSAIRTRLRPSRVLTEITMDVLCRPPEDRETVNWDFRPFDEAMLRQTLASSEEGQRVARVREVYREVLRRDATPDDCATVRALVDRRLDEAGMRRHLDAQPEARRVAQVRKVFVDTLGRDPRAWDDQGLRRWVDSPYPIAEIRSRLPAQRPLVGVHYFAWYRQEPGGWRNDLTSVPAEAPVPVIGRYDSGDTDVIPTQIMQMEEAGFDFAIVHVIATSPRTWSNARIFMDRLSGHRLKAAILIDGLYAEPPASKAMWVEKAKDEFAGDSHYLRLNGEPLIMLFSALVNFTVPGVLLRNVYWTDRYDPGRNSFNPNHRLEPHDWPFWAPTPPPLANGMVPVIPGYTDAALGRPRTMVHPRENGQMYREQWERALALHPEVIVVYGWNEYFEQTAIEPTDAWGNQYLEMSACFIERAHRGTGGAC